MVGKSNINILEVRSRERILRVLYDGKERSAYKIAKEIDMAIATVIEHLEKLREAGLVEMRDATKGNLKRRFYKITDKGKELLLKYYQNLAKEIKKNEEIARTFADFLGRL